MRLENALEGQVEKIMSSETLTRLGFRVKGLGFRAICEKHVWSIFLDSRDVSRPKTAKGPFG